MARLASVSVLVVEGHELGREAVGTGCFSRHVGDWSGDHAGVAAAILAVARRDAVDVAGVAGAAPAGECAWRVAAGVASKQFID